MVELHPIYTLPQSVHPYVKVCYAIAKEAHAAVEQTRNKAGSIKLDYITHPAAALNILLVSGETDPVVMAAALLHDVLEDCEDYLKAQANEKGITAEPPYAAVLKELIDQALEKEADEGLLHKPAEQWLADTRRMVGLVEELTAPKGLGKIKRIQRALSAMDYSEDAAKIKIAELAASLADDIITKPQKQGAEQLEYNDYVWAVAKSAAHLSDSQPKKQRNAQITNLFKLVNHLHSEHRLLNDYPDPRLDEQEKASKRENFSLNTAWARAMGMPDWKRAVPAVMYVEHPEVKTQAHGLTHVGLSADGLVTRARVVFDYDSDKADEHYAIINHLTRLIERGDAGNAVTYGRSDVKASEQAHHQIKLKLLKPMPIEQFLEYAEQAGAIDKEKDGFFYDSLEFSAAQLKDPKDKAAQGRWGDLVKGRLQKAEASPAMGA